MNVQDYRDQEKQWANRLYGLSLVSEASFDILESLNAFRFVLNSYKAQSGDKDDRNRVLQRYPASLLAGLTGIASSQYDEGTFWPRVADTTGIQITQVYQSELSDAFRFGLDRFQLSRFDTPQRNIGEILMHAGIPVPSAESFFQLLILRDTRRPDLTGEDFCAWVGAMTREVASAKGIDAPTWRFLKEGGAVSADLTERFLIFLDAAATNRRDLYEEALSSIPAQLAQEVDRLYVSGLLHTSSRRINTRRHDSAPSIIYKDGLIQLALPPMESPVLGEHAWRFTTAGESWSRTLGSSWSSGRSLSAYEPISRPITDIVVSYPLLDRDWKLNLVDTEMPLLAFDYSSGRYLPTTHQLPQSWIWLAFPGEAASLVSDNVEVEGTLEIREVANTPTGWPGWKFVAADLSNVKRLRPINITNRWRLVSTIKRPVLRISSEVPFVRSLSGSSIYGDRPKMFLPGAATQSGDSPQVEWHIQTLDRSDSVITSFPVQVGTEGIEIDPWKGTCTTLLGDFQVRATGILGQSATFDMTIAEGLKVHASPPFRYIDSQGSLEPAMVELQFGAESSEIRILAGEVSSEFVLTNGQASMPVVVFPPHMWMKAERSGSSVHASIRPLLLEIEQLPESILRLHIESDQRCTLELHTEHSTIVEEPLFGGSSGVVTVPLARFHDSCQSTGGGELYLQRRDGISLIGRVRPKRLVTGAILIDDTITLERVYENLDLQVVLQVENAPWLHINPIRFPPATSSSELPASARGRGPLTALVRPYDPWEIGLEGEHEIPDRENRLHIDSEFSLFPESIEDRFIHWVADIGTIPDDRGGIEFALDIYGAIRKCRPRERADRLARDVARLTDEVGPRLLAVAASSQWSQSSHTRLLVEGWPATAKVMSYPANADLWRRSPYLGILVSLGCLKDGDATSELSEKLGDEARLIMLEGCDPALRVGTFGDHNVDLLAEKPREIQDRFWKTYLAVPGRPLNAQQRELNARFLFDRREDIRLHRLIKASPTIIDEMISVLRLDFGEPAVAPLIARKAPRNWRLLPQASLALAFAARLTARGSSSAEDIYRYAQSWYADLADCAPAFTEQDLILSELWLTNWENS